MTPLFRVCITGPESTGKTELAASLAKALETEWVPEGARVYAERVMRELTSADVEPIAREHIALAKRAQECALDSGLTVLVLDTDLISTIVYGRHYYGFTSEWLEREAGARLADLYLLCDVSIPWEADGIRDRPDDREEWYGEFAEALRERGARVVALGGSREERLRAALDAVLSVRT